MIQFRLQTLGALRLIGDAGELLRGRRRELVLLAYLARRAPRAVSRQELAALLWGEREESRARQSLRQAFYGLRTALGDRIRIDAEHAVLAEQTLELDATAFEREVTEEQLDRAVARWGGDFLAGMEDLGGEHYRSWLEAEREGLRRRLAWALERLVASAEHRRAWDEAVAWAEHLAAAFPLEETAHVRLVQALAAGHRIADALACHGAFAARVREELYADPSDEFHELGRALQRAPAGMSGPGSAALLAPDVIGRDDALAALSSAWTDAQAQGGLMLVEGEEGIGRTRLCREFLGRLRALPEAPFVLQVQAKEGNEPGSTVRRLFAAIRQAPGLSGAPDQALAELTRLVPDLRGRFANLPDPSGDEAALATAIARVLEDVAAEVPILVCIDDLPQADSISQRLILTIAHAVPPGVLLLVTGQPAPLAATEANARLQQAPNLRRVKLRPLAEAELETMLDSMLPLDVASRRLLASRLHAETGGNPLYAVELVSALADAGLLVPDAAGAWHADEGIGKVSLPLPTGLRAAILTRIERLPAAARQLLDAAAVLGTGLEAGLLQEVSALGDGDFVGALDELVARRMLRPPESPEAGYEFSQGLIRRLAYTALPEPHRQALHGAVLSALLRRREGGARLRSHRERAGALPPSLWLRLHPRAAVVVGVFALVMAAGALAIGRNGRFEPIAPDAVAIFSFSVQGDERFAYAGQAVASLLATALDGAPGLRSVDPLRLHDFAAADRNAVLDPTRAQPLAARLGAALFVLGTIIESGGRLQATASLYDRGGERRAVARAVVESDSDLFTLTDALARDLLAGLQPGTRGELARVAASTTTSLTAFKDYLNGEDALRRGQYDEAIVAFQRALDEDSTFALASYRMTVAAEWRNDDATAEKALARALRQRDRLPERYRLLAAADSARLVGDVGEAERRYRRVLAGHPDEAHAWYQLGEVLIHFNPLRGRPLAEAAPAFERVLDFDPDNYEARWHLAQLAASAADVGALEHWVEPLLAGGESDRITWRALRSILRRDSAAIRLDREALDDVPDDVAYVGAWLVPLLLRDLNEAERRATAVTSTRRAPEWRAAGHLLAAHAQLARGQRQAAIEEIRAAERLYTSTMLAYRAWFSVLPIAPPVRTETLAAIRADLLRWDASSTGASNVPHPFVSLHDGAHAHIRLYLLGLVSTQLGDAAAARQAVAELRRLGAAPHAETLATDFALAVEAEIARHGGDPVRALALLQRMQLRSTPLGTTLSPFYSHARERFVRAELLFALGRTDDAGRWFASVAESPPFGYVFLARSLLRRAAHHEARGEYRPAAELYEQFIEIWSDADPDLRPAVEQARRTLEQLRAGSSRGS